MGNGVAQQDNTAPILDSTVNRRPRASLGKSAGAIAMPERSRDSAVWPVFARKSRCVVNQKARRISKSKIFACRGREANRSAPPAQNRTSAFTHPASPLNEWPQSVVWNKDEKRGDAKSFARRGGRAAP